MTSTPTVPRRQYRSLGEVPVDDAENLTSVLRHLRTRAPDRPVVSTGSDRSPDAAFEDRPARWFVDEVVSIARGLIDAIYGGDAS